MLPRRGQNAAGRAAAGTGAIGVAARQLQPLSDLPKECRNCCGIELGHACKDNCRTERGFRLVGDRRTPCNATVRPALDDPNHTVSPEDP